MEFKRENYSDGLIKEMLPLFEAQACSPLLHHRSISRRKGVPRELQVQYIHPLHGLLFPRNRCARRVNPRPRASHVPCRPRASHVPCRPRTSSPCRLPVAAAPSPPFSSTLLPALALHTPKPSLPVGVWLTATPSANTTYRKTVRNAEPLGSQFNAACFSRQIHPAIGASVSHRD